jgi:class 3 adenylate cyclase
MVDASHARYLAREIPGARLVEFSGTDHFWWTEDQDGVLAEIEEFLTGSRPRAHIDRVLATVLFTDIVESTRRASELGDRRWRTVLDQHDTLCARQVERFGGRLVKTTGDGILATFDGPARAVRCARAIGDGSASLDLAIRAGVHTGEVELRGGDVAGLAVHLAQRVCALAPSGVVLVSRTVVDLVVGSELEFHDHGTHELKGVPGTWQLFSVTV